MNNWIGYSLILIIVCLIIYFWYTNQKNLNIFYEGLWIAGDNFCSRSDLDGMMIYIGPKLEKNTRKAFMVLYTDSNVISQQLILTISGFGSRKKIKIQCDPDSDHIETILPELLVAYVNMTTGHMVWYCDDVMYAELYKDSLSTAEATR